jgi:hypothetical protein
MEPTELAALKADHKLRVERRAKFLATLTPRERQIRDGYIAWVRWWRKEYAKLVLEIIKNKKFIRVQGHNNLVSLKYATRLLEQQRLRARMMLFARVAGKVDYGMKMEEPTKKPLRVVL